MNKESIFTKMQVIEARTDTVEDFIQECLKQDFEYEDIHDYLRKIHKG